MPDTPQQPIVIVRRKGAHGSHHGGAWKVAYADFVTAMMALFIVLWLMNTSDHVRKAVAGYFNDPSGKSTETGTDHAGSNDSLPLTRDNISDIKQRLEQSISQSLNLKALQSQIVMTVTPEGLRIELLESSHGTFFESGGTELSQSGKDLLTLLARQLGGLPNRISIEGHTDAKPYSDSHAYSNWELSVDRANAARRLMQESGLQADQVNQVRGFADQRLRLPQAPYDPSNRRISVIVQYAHGEAKTPESKTPAG